jgi:hypothetical protein
MNNILGLKGIKTVSYIDDEKIKHQIAYTSNMLANRIFIELYEEENTDDPESDEGYKTVISVFMSYAEKYYEFTMLLDTRPVISRISLYRTILDTVEIIETSNPLSLPRNLEEAAMASVNSGIYVDPQWKDDFDNKVKEKIKRVLGGG